MAEGNGCHQDWQSLYYQVSQEHCISLLGSQTRWLYGWINRLEKIEMIGKRDMRNKWDRSRIEHWLWLFKQYYGITTYDPEILLFRTTVISIPLVMWYLDAMIYDVEPYNLNAIDHGVDPEDPKQSSSRIILWFKHDNNPIHNVNMRFWKKEYKKIGLSVLTCLATFQVLESTLDIHKFVKEFNISYFCSDRWHAGRFWWFHAHAKRF